MRGIVQPFTGALHEQDGEGNIKVTLDGRVGWFTTQGEYLRGELQECDPQLCGWVGGPQIANHRTGSSPVDAD